MKTALFLCILIGAVLVLGGCADQNTTADVTGYGTNRATATEPGVSGSVGGGGGHPPNQTGMAHIP